MQIDIRGPGSEVTDAVHRHIEQRVHGVLARFASYILHVTVRLEEAGHLRPGGGTHCHIAAAVPGSGHVTADVIDLSVMTAIHRALDHIAQALAHDFGPQVAHAVALPLPVRLAPSAVFRRSPRDAAAERPHTREGPPAFELDFCEFHGEKFSHDACRRRG